MKLKYWTGFSKRKNSTLRPNDAQATEIDVVLNKLNNIEQYIILDDDTDMEEHQLPFFIKTDPYNDGLNKEVANKAIEILK